MTEFNVGDIVKPHRLQGAKGLIGIITEFNPNVVFSYRVEWLNPRIGHSRWGHTYGYFNISNLRKVE